MRDGQTVIEDKKIVEALERQFARMRDKRMTVRCPKCERKVRLLSIGSKSLVPYHCVPGIVNIMGSKMLCSMSRKLFNRHPMSGQGVKK